MGSFFHRAALLKCWRGRAGRISIRKAISSRRRVGSSDGEKRTVLVALATDPPPGRGHLRPPRRTPLLLGPSRTGSVPPGTWAGRELARPRRSPLADDPHDRKAIR